MASAHSGNLGAFSAESVALQLMHIVLEAEGKKAGGGSHEQYPKEYASRKEILDTYHECITAVHERRIVRP